MFRCDWCSRERDSSKQKGRRQGGRAGPFVSQVGVIVNTEKGIGGRGRVSFRLSSKTTCVGTLQKRRLIDHTSPPYSRSGESETKATLTSLRCSTVGRAQWRMQALENFVMGIPCRCRPMSGTPQRIEPWRFVLLRAGIRASSNSGAGEGRTSVDTKVLCPFRGWTNPAPGESAERTIYFVLKNAFEIVEPSCAVIRAT